MCPAIGKRSINLQKKHFKKLIETYKNWVPKESSLTFIIKKGKVYQEIVGQAQAFQDSIIVFFIYWASGI